MFLKKNLSGNRNSWLKLCFTKKLFLYMFQNIPHVLKKKKWTNFEGNLHSVLQDRAPSLGRIFYCWMLLLSVFFSHKLRFGNIPQLRLMNLNKSQQRVPPDVRVSEMPFRCQHPARRLPLQRQRRLQQPGPVGTNRYKTSLGNITVLNCP